MNKCKHTELEILMYNPDGSIVFFCSLCGSIVENIDEYDQEQEIEHILGINTTIEGKKLC